MRNRALHDALREFALEAAASLTDALRGGVEIPFDVVEEPGVGTVLYRYRPLTAELIAARWPALRELPSFEPAAEALGSGAQTYLRMRAVGDGADSEEALRAMLERLYEDATAFEFPEERFERTYAEVERVLYETTIRVAIAAPLHGARLESELAVDLGDGLFLVPGDRIDAPREAVWPDGREEGTEPTVLCVLRRDQATTEPLPVDEARARFRTLLTGLRLYKSGGLALGPMAWGRIDDGPWQPLGLGDSGQARGAPWTLSDAELPELVELLDVLCASHAGGRLAWALTRFELGCARPSDTEALSDHLLALESLLDGRDDAGRAGLALRLAALCAEDGDRKAVQRRVEVAFALERWLMSGRGGDAYLEEMGAESPRALVLAIEDHVRALLRDVLCGYLESDLKSAADDILLTSSEPIEIRAADLRGEQIRATDLRAERRAAAEPPPPPPPPPPPDADADADADAGVTPSADWEAADDDPANFSAPV